MTGIEELAALGASAASTAAAALPSATTLTAASTALGIGGTVLSSMASSNAAKAQAEQDKARANAERVAAQSKAQEETRKKEILLSRQRAMLGASGAGVTGTASQLLADTEGQGIYNSELQQWQGEQAARGYEADAKMKLYGASQEKAALPLQIGSQIITGASKIYDKASIGDGPIIDASYDPNSGFFTTVKKNSAYRYG